MIEFRDFTFQYDSQAEPTLKKINLTINQGEKILIMGPSGSGKSTLGKCLNGIIPQNEKGTFTGSLMINGKTFSESSIYDLSLDVGTVLQDTDSQFVGLTVAEDIAFSLENEMIQQAEMREAVNHWAEKTNLLTQLEKRPQDLSGGQKQRVSLAGVLIDESPILLFDEPLANLDPKSGQDIIDLIDQIHEEQGTTTIIIEHRLEDVLYRPVDRVILINQGQVLFNGQPDELLRTTLLGENGIREPLYLTTLRQLGQDLDQLEHLDRLEDIELTGVNHAIPEATFAKTGEAEELLKLEQISFAYQENHPILKNISLSIPKGQRLAIVGKNGAGKSTLAKAICGFITTEGQYTFRGEDIKQESVKERAERVGYVLQNPNQMISTNMIFDEVALGLRLRGVAEEDIKERVYQALKTCGLYEFRKWPISALSYGQKKRVTIASILVLGPEILVLDEPTAGQDQRNYTEIMEFLDTLQQKGHTIVMITHDMQLMLDYSDRAVVVTDGQIIADLSPAALFTRPDILRQANLKETSIFDLANRLGMDPLDLTQFYMQQKGEGHESSISRLP